MALNCAKMGLIKAFDFYDMSNNGLTRCDTPFAISVIMYSKPATLFLYYLRILDLLFLGLFITP